MQLPSVNSAVFGSAVVVSVLQDLTTRVQRLMAYLLADVTAENWLPDLLSGLSSGKLPNTYDGVSQLLHEFILDKGVQDSVREARTVYTLLQHVLPQAGASKQDGDQFIMIARGIDKRGTIY